MKKLKYFVFAVIFFLLFCINTFALDCEYSDGKLTTSFTIKESNGDVSTAIVNGDLNSSNITHVDNESQGIENWDEVFDPAFDPSNTKINAKGLDYYKAYNACPPYVIFVDRSGQFDLAVSTESHLNEFKKYGESKQGYSIMKLVKSTYAKDGGGGGTAVRDSGSSCASYTKEEDCTESNVFACVWNETKYGNYCNTDNLTYVQCGDIFDIPSEIPPIAKFVIDLLKIVTPIILVIVGMITLIKALAAAKEDEMTKAKNSLIKKVVAAVIVFFVVSIVQFVISLVADGSAEANNFSNCLSCFLNSDCEDNIYYKTNVSGTYSCKYINGSKATFPCKGNK